MSGVRMVPRVVQLRLDEPTDAELLALLRTDRAAIRELRRTGGPAQGWNAGACDRYQAAADAITDLYRALDRETYVRVLDRMRALRAQVRAERTPP